MRTYSHLYSSQRRFQAFLTQHDIQDGSSLFMQVFMSSNDADKMKKTLDELAQFLPSAKLIATSTAGEIVAGGMQDDTTVVSICVFEKTRVDVALIESASGAEMASEIAHRMSEDTKLIICFNNIYANDGEEIINALQQVDSKVMITGGNAGDNGEFNAQTVVGCNTEVSTSAMAVALLSSDHLLVHNSHFFNWQTIGNFLRITRSIGNTVYEIEGQKAKDVYRDYLGGDVTDSLPGSGVEFPLVFEEDGIKIARAPVALGEDGSLIMAGSIPEGTQVQFGFGNVAENDRNVEKEVEAFSNFPIEAIFIYSCSARKYFLGDHLNHEFELLEKIAPTAGFITYGEFFKQECTNKLLNVTSTFVGLSEDPEAINKVHLDTRRKSKKTRTLNALTHLVRKTTADLQESITSLVSFQELIKTSTIYSRTDVRGIITDVNERFCKISGYTREELIGSSHNIVRHKDMPKEAYIQMWRTLQNGEPWKGVLKNRAKNGDVYYVRSFIFPIFNASNILEGYISLRDDITEEVEKHNRLEGNMNELQEYTEEKEFLLKQYERVIDLNSAFIRMDEHFDLTYVNEVFCKIYDCDNETLLNRNLTQFIDTDQSMLDFKEVKTALQSEGNWQGILPLKHEKKVIYMETKITAIYDRNNHLVEYMVALHDITDLVNAQMEIEETQKDVVFTMGAIGETRSQETGNHVKRVAEYSKLFALHYGLSEQKAELLKMASPMHDIGKVGIPDAILNKPGSLNEKEWKIMKTHAALGYQMLKNSKREILQTAAIIAYTHHEKWDGSGYPKGLKGEDIDIMGRITAIADVFDALGSDRCYKKAWEDEKIFDLLREESGKHFDPALVEIFFEHLPEFLAVRDRFVD